MSAEQTLEMNIEERLWAVGTKTAQHCLAYRMMDDGDDILFTGNLRIYEDIIILENYN